MMAAETKKTRIDILRESKDRTLSTWVIFCLISQDAYDCNKRKIKRLVWSIGFIFSYKKKPEGKVAPGQGNSVA